AQPAALGRGRLDGRFGAGLDPCAALQSVLELAPGESREVIILFGETDDADNARQLIARQLDSSAVDASFKSVLEYWDEILSRVEVSTPDAAMNLLLNRWLLYQTLACRLWARSAFYQPGVAYGFRDQLQDAMALVHAEPRLLREHLL